VDKRGSKMGIVIGSGRRKLNEKCVICEKTFPEDELVLEPYNKTKTLELMCKNCKTGVQEEVKLTSEKQPDKNKITTKKKKNKIKEIVNEEAEEMGEKSTCMCAKFPMCKAIRATQAWDEFSNKEIKAFFVGAGFDFFKIDFCPFCGESLYKKEG